MDNCIHGVDARNQCEECSDLRRVEYKVYDARDAVGTKRQAVIEAARTGDQAKVNVAVRELEEAEKKYTEMEKAYAAAMGGAKWEHLF